MIGRTKRVCGLVFDKSVISTKRKKRTWKRREKERTDKKESPTGGLEPPTTRLRA